MKKRVFRGAVIAFIWLLIWQGLSMLAGSSFLFPSPVDTAVSLLSMLGGAALWLSIGASLLRVLLGYGAAVIVGVALGALTAMLPLADAFFKPLRSIIKATPVASFILLLQLWMNTDMIPAFTGFLMVMPMIWANVQQGIRSTDPELLEMARLFRVRRWRVFREVYVPSVFPYFLSACATGLGFTWKASVAAEVIVRTGQSIGKNLVESKNYLFTEDMFAWTAVVVILSILLERVLLRALSRVRTGQRWGEG